MIVGFAPGSAPDIVARLIGNGCRTALASRS
jgi:tripartite-type tricarboxylate transporter receptor subunit TctC